MKIIRISGLMALFALLFSYKMLAGNIIADDYFKRACDNYTKGNYTKAAELYLDLINNGYTGKEICFDLGNAYYKMNNIPASILYYERALKLDPNDEDIIFNLRIANLKIVDKIDPLPKFFITEWYENLHTTYSSSTWALLCTVFSWMTCLMLSIFFISWQPFIKKITFAGFLIGLGFFIFSMIFAIQQYSVEKSRDTAIIFAPNVYVNNSPDEGSTKLFILHEGTKVKVLDTVNNWKKIRIADGKIGWIQENSIEII